MRRPGASHAVAIVAAMANQSLYRRYRPRRFSELKGQDHVVKALRTAVAEGREGQAYLFSGPRGTGKTTTARILAKVLNCENPVDGEPCCVCESCLSVERGTSYDVHELDAASNNGVEAMRDLIEKASLGTPGRHKVYILDEVHMLSKAAEAALLKTLEEPPPHVVFVLATTDPQKMSDTIRSRTQHLQFHLIGTDTLGEHVRWVAADAGLDVSDAAVEQVLRQGAGSARDALSALELLASTGDDGIDTVPLDEFVEAMIDREPGRALTMVAHSIGIGRDSRTLTEELIRFMRDEFLCLMAPELVQVSGQHIDALTEQAGRLGAAGLVRGIEVLGAALTDMRHAPDPRVLLDVAAVQLTSDAVSPDLPALTARLHRVEQQLADGPPVHAVPTGQPGPAAASSPAAPGRVALGGRARAADDVATSPDDANAPVAASAVEPGTAPAVGVVPASVITSEQWEQNIRPALRGMTRAVFAPASLLTSTEGTVTFSLPNAVHREKCEQHREALEVAIRALTGAEVSVQLAVEGQPSEHQVSSGPPVTPVADTAPATPAADVSSDSPVDPAPAEAGDAPAGDALAGDAPAGDEDVDLDDLVDVPPESVKSPIDRLAEAFPGSELVDERS
jgi:DNA polymerase III subunit gamma/tau